MAQYKEPSPYQAMGNESVDLLMGDAQMAMADPNTTFGNHHIQSLKSDIFAMSLLEGDGGGKLRSVYGPSLDAMEKSLSKKVDAQATTAYNVFRAEKQKFDLQKAQEGARTERENQEKYAEMAGNISAILESPLSTQDKSRIIFHGFTEEPNFMASPSGQTLLGMTNKQLTNRELSDAQSKVLTDAISSGSPEAINKVMDSQGVPQGDPIREGAILSARARASKAAMEAQEESYKDKLRALNDYADDALAEPSHQSVLKFAEQLIPDARSMGLSELQSFKDLKSWTTKPAPSEDEMTYGPGFEVPIANIISLMFEMSKKSNVPGARQSLRRNPSTRSSASLDQLGIPSR